MTGVFAGLIGSMQGDTTGPVVPTPTRTTSGSMASATQTDTVSWGAITDAYSGVSSATVYQLYNGSVSGFVAGTSQALGSFGAGSTTFAIPTNRRQADGGQAWTVYYYIIATDVAGNSTTGTASSAAATLRYDIAGPVVPTTTVVSGATSDTVSWGAITDAGSGVASATVYQLYVGSVSGFVGGTSQVLGSFGASNTTFAIPTNRRNTPSGETWIVTYYITAVDAAGNSTQGGNPGGKNTKPYGSYNFLTGADSRNLANSAWLGTTTEGIVGYSTTSRAYGCWFYGTDTIKTACKGWDADSGTIFVKRAASTDTNRGNTGTFYLKTHNLGSASGAATFSGTAMTVYLSGNSASAYVTINSTALTALQDGTGQGIGMYFHDNQPGFLLGNRDFSGLITLVYN